jgi:DNA polymerase-1
MINLDAILTKISPDSRILLQIHDELLISAPEGQAQEVEALVKRELEGVVHWSIPLVVTTRIGTDWKEVSK